MNKFWKYISGVFGLALITVLLTTVFAPDNKLHLIACDVGQGDAILAVYKTNQILIDGGPDKKILDCLGKYMPFWDKKIEVVILTHPQQDHYGGLIEIFRSYEVETFVANAVDSGTSGYSVLKNLVEGSGARVVNPDGETAIRLGLLYLDILHPSGQYILSEVEGSDNGVLGAFTTKWDLNEFSIVAVLSLGEFDALLTGDIGPDISDQIAKELVVSSSRTIEYIKVPHHGSKNGLTRKLLEASMPEVAIISAGKNNRYGHPHEEILKMLNDKGIKIFRTDERGDVEVITDGESWQIVD